MGQNSQIAWTHHTFNPWWGCTKVSAACKHCYAEAWSKRMGQSVWGAKAKRRFFGEKHWSEPVKWNARAEQSGARFRVFCASMADVFEERRELDAWREQLWALIEITPGLDWLLLTKRPEAVRRLVRWRGKWPANLWLGTTVEDQECAEARLPYLAELPAFVRFVSAEPLLGPIDMRPWLGSVVNWVITGGESGPRSRLSSPSWFRSLLAQCKAAEVPFYFQQWGDWAPASGRSGRTSAAADGTVMLRLGKKAAGRLLDGAIWDEFPRGMIAHADISRSAAHRHPG